MPTLKPCEKCARDYYPLRRGFCNRCDYRRRAKIGYQSSHVDAEAARLHIKELVAAGVGMRRIAELAGINRKIIQIIVNGRSDRGTQPSKRISIKNSEAILAVPIPDITHRAVAGGSIVPALGTVRRMQSLVAFGWPKSHLAARLGWTPANATRLFRDSTPTVVASTARKVEALYNELEATPGHSSRARNEGKRNGWAAPMAWDDIDNPDDQPILDEVKPTFTELYSEMRELGYGNHEIIARYPVKRCDRHEAVGVLSDVGLSAKEIADLIGRSQRSVVRYRADNRLPVKDDWIREQAG